MTPAEYEKKNDPLFFANMPQDRKLYEYDDWFVCMPGEGFNYTEYDDHEVLAHYLIAPERKKSFDDEYWYTTVGFSTCLKLLEKRLEGEKYVIRILSIAARSVDHFHCHILHLGRKLREQKHGKPSETETASVQKETNDI